MSQLDQTLVFYALANPVRRKILSIVREQPGCGVGDVADQFSMSRIGVMKHLELLREAGLLVSQKQGRARRLYFNVMPIQLIYEHWTDEYSSAWAGRIAAFKDTVEAGEEDERRRTSRI